MTVLAIDTTRRGAASIALAERDGTVLQRAAVDGPLDTGVPPVLARLAGAELDAVVVLTGPGSYTGVRAGMALGLGLATARGVPLHGVDILSAVGAAGPREQRVTLAVDAGRGGAYAVDADASAPTPRLLGAPRRVAWEELAGGDGVVVAVAPPPGIDAVTVSVDGVLGAAIRLALARPPLAAAGLAAVPPPPG